ncbi:ODV-E56 [Aratus pisonii nudivirus]|nr:ODV-E56 [Aratus pisonii nudivirus]
MTSWLKSIRYGSTPLKTVDDFATNVDLIKNADSGVSNIDNTIKNLDYKQVGDEIHVNNARFRDMEEKFRLGEISDALKDADVVSTITTSEESILKNTLSKEAPDIDIKKLDDRIESAKSVHKDLDVTSTSGADLESKLSESSKEKAKSIWTKIVNVVGVGAVAAGVFTAVIITTNVFEDISNAAQARNGCFLTYKASNTQACKIPSKSCGYGVTSGTSEPICSTSDVQDLKYNIYCMVNHFVNTGATTNIDELVALGCTWPVDATADDVLMIESNIPILSSYYDTQYPDFGTVPFVACSIVGSDYVGCVACDPTQPTNSPYFSSSETLDGNMMYKCITNTTSIEAITDIATSVGVDIFSASGDSISGSFQGNFFIAVIIILFLIAVIALIIKVIPKKKSVETVSQLDKSSTAAAPVASQPQPQQQPEPMTTNDIQIR